MFNQQELQILLGGVNSPIDLEDLRAHTQYGGLYNDQEPTIQVFWRVSRHSLCFVVEFPAYRWSFAVGRQLVQPRTTSCIAPLCDEL